MNKRKITTIAEGGKLLCYVPLNADGRRSAVIWKDDFDFLLTLGVKDSWFTTGKADRYVVCKIPGRKGRNIQVSRLMLNAGAGQVVRYRDGDSYNLRRENLYLDCGGTSTKRALELFSQHLVGANALG